MIYLGMSSVSLEKVLNFMPIRVVFSFVDGYNCFPQGTTRGIVKNQLIATELVVVVAGREINHGFRCLEGKLTEMVKVRQHRTSLDDS